MNPNEFAYISNETVILEAATKLFYDNGYNKTSCAQIAKEAGLSKASIFYYYPSKIEVANRVYFSYTKNTKEIVTQKMMNHDFTYNLQLGTAIELCLEMDMYKQDEKAFRFMKEFFDNNFQILYKEPPVEFYALHRRRYNLPFTDDELKVIAALSSTSSTALMLMYFSGETQLSYDAVLRMRLRSPFEAMGIPNEQIDEILERSLLLRNELNFTIEPYFKIK